MIIQAPELPKEAAGLALEAERAARAAPVREEPARPAREPAEAEPDPRGDSGKLDRKDAERLVREAQEYFTKKGVDLNFRLLGDAKELQVEVVDARSHKVIRKIPEDEIVTLSDNLKRMAKGVMDKAV